MIHTVITIGDWVWLHQIEADTEEEALRKAAADQIQAIKSNDPTYEIWAGKITGRSTPNLRLSLRSRCPHTGKEREDARLIIPDTGD